MLLQKDFAVGLSWCIYGLEFISWGHLSAVVAWAAATILMGFCNGMWHGTPLAWEILVVRIIASAISPSFNEKFVATFTHKITTIKFTIFILVIAIAFNIVHLVFSALEVNSCTSALCENPATYWFLFVFLFILGIIIVLEIILIVYFIKYIKYIQLHLSSSSGDLKKR